MPLDLSGLRLRSRTSWAWFGHHQNRWESPSIEGNAPKAEAWGLIMAIDLFSSLEEISLSCSVGGLDRKTVICSGGNFAESKRRGTPPDFRKEARATPPPENAPGSCSTLEELLPQVTCLYRDESASLYFNPTEEGALCRGGLQSASLGNGRGRVLQVHPLVLWSRSQFPSGDHRITYNNWEAR